METEFCITEDDIEMSYIKYSSYSTKQNHSMIPFSEEKVLITFSGSAGLSNYQFGIGKYIQDNYDLRKCVFAGASGGSLVAFCLALDLNLEEIHNKFVETELAYTRKRLFRAFFKIYDDLKLFLHKLLFAKPDAYKICDGRLFVSITEVYPSFKNHIISQWTSNDDLIESIIISCFIPVFGGEFALPYRSMYCIDGGLSFFIPIHDYRLPRIEISPWKFRSLPLTLLHISTNSKTNKWLFKLGYEDAKNNDNEFNLHLNSR